METIHTVFARRDLETDRFRAPYWCARERFEALEKAGRDTRVARVAMKQHERALLAAEARLERTREARNWRWERLVDADIDAAAAAVTVEA